MFLLNIPLVPTKLRDAIMWHYSSNEVFTVKGAYHRGIDVKERNLGERADAS